jgi:hypothetical protein
MIFNTIEELLTQAEKDGACSEGLEWAKRQSSLHEAFNSISYDHVFWCLTKGYHQFAEYCPWDRFEGCDWYWLLRVQPQYHDKCNWSLLSGWNWAYLLRDQPQFHDKCDWNLLDDRDWRYLICYQPQLETYRIKNY